MGLIDYDIEEAFREIEHELIESMVRNMRLHKAEENVEGINWSMWQAEQLQALEQYRKVNSKKFTKQFGDIDNAIEKAIRQARKQGTLDQEVEILEALKDGFKMDKKLGGTVTQAAFFKLNNRKMDALIKATRSDMRKAETAMLRMANDQYRKVIFNAQVYANSGAATYEKAVDMATKDFLSTGINCIQYKNGARVNIASYAAMAIRTANKRAYLTGEGEKRQEWGISTVIVNKRGIACPKCIRYAGKIFIDDVWSGGKPGDGRYPLLSTAIRGGLYHPNCKDSHTTYFPGITTEPQPPTKRQIGKVLSEYRKQQEEKYNKRMVQKYNTLASHSLDEENKNTYKQRARQWMDKARGRFVSRERKIIKDFNEGLDKVGNLDVKIQKRICFKS